MIAFFLEWTCFEILTLISGQLGVTEQATFVILYNLATILWGIPCGVQAAITAMIGKEIGAGNIENAKRLYKNTIVLIITVASSMFVTNFILRKHFIKIFTNSEEI